MSFKAMVLWKAITVSISQLGLISSDRGGIAVAVGKKT